MDAIVIRKLHELKPHPRNSMIFGDPRSVPEYAEIKHSILVNGLQEPLVIKADGTILSGHLRFQALRELAAEAKKYAHEVDVSVRIHSDFETAAEELSYLFDANIQRRQLTPRQIAAAYAAMLESLPPDEDKGKGGRPRKDTSKHLPHRRVGTKERVARIFQVSVRTADYLALIYQTAGVPGDVLEMVDAKQISVSLAADAVRYALEAAHRRDPEMTSVSVSPIDVHAYLKYPPEQRRRVSDLVRGEKPQPDPPITVENMPVPGYFSRIEPSPIPQPFTPKQRMKDMVLQGVEYSDLDHMDPGLPLHESVARIRMRLTEAFANAHIVQEERVISALEPLLERVAHYLRSMGKEITVVQDNQKKKVLPESLYERLVLLRFTLEESDPDCDPAVLRSLLSDIAKTAKDRSTTIRTVQKTMPIAATGAPVHKKEVPVFDNEIDFIVHVLGIDAVNTLGV